MAQVTSNLISEPSATFSRSKGFTIIAHIVRVILGLIFLVFGLNGFFHFITMAGPTGPAGDFVIGLVKSQYFLPLMAFFQVLCGVLLLSGWLVPLALLLLFPITLNILLFHLALAPEGSIMAVFIMASNILLAVYYWPVYKPIFKTGNAWKSNKL